MMPGVSIRCPHRDQTGMSWNHTHYDGTRSKAPGRRKCRLCGGQLRSEPTVWGAVDYRADGRYDRPAQTFSSPEAAAAAGTGEQVIRRFAVE